VPAADISPSAAGLPPWKEGGPMQLIPPHISSNTKSDAERLTYDKLKESGIRGVTIHSLELARHQSKLYSEIDFLVITERGVLCLEVKGGLVRLEQGEWVYIDRYGNSHGKEESPFVQARSNKESVMKYVREVYKKKNGSEIKYCVYGYGVVFNDTVFNESGVGIDSEIVFDQSMASFDEYLNSLYDLWETRISERINATLHNSRMPRLNPGHISLLQELLLGKTTHQNESVLDRNFHDVDGKLSELSDEQYKVFQYGIQNRRQLIEGGAGTGKTLIGIKYAVEKAREGNRVLFICFNVLLAKWIKELLSGQVDEDLDIKVISFHEHLLEVTGLGIPEEQAELNDFYQNKLPTAFVEMADSYDPYDTLIVDEGQDLLLENYLLCIDQFVIGGLDHGNWVMMYDENQNIYLREKFQTGLKAVKAYEPFLGTLRENYRNTRQIDQANQELTSIPSKAFSGLEGEAVEIFEYLDHSEGQKKLKAIVKSLKKKGISNQDIVILSPHRFEHSMLEGNHQVLQGMAPIQPMQGKTGRIVAVPDHAIKFSSIYSFKGLESHVVILIGVEKEDDFSRRLLYTGISRAKSKLYVLQPRAN
jgi:superfamily I DNA and RNA helicase